ncbi:hypothetical protein ACFVXG_26415 [Kitasatospora sp. NPDC058162]|uniref:hypothetical protein n=1 Tax=Kitasatospora sp. NPDC058162 TaxID=3346362 RepID=UPI0036DE9F1E
MTARDYLGLARELLAVSYRRSRRLTIGVLLTQALSLITVAATALTLRAAINGAIDHDAGSAAAGAVAAALVYAATAALGDMGFNIKGQLVDQVAVLDLPASINRDIALLEGLEHVERSDFLDRVTIVLGGPWHIVNGFWSGVTAVFGLLQLGVSLLLLGTVSPWLLLLLLFAAAPLWFDRQGQRRVSRAETETAEAIRLQRHLFETASEAAAAKEIRVAGAGGELARRQAAVWEEAAEHRFRSQLRAAAWRVSGWALFTAGFVAALAVVIHRTARGHGSPGDIVLAVTVASTLRGSVEAAVGRTTDSAPWTSTKPCTPCRSRRAESATGGRASSPPRRASSPSASPRTPPVP